MALYLYRNNHFNSHLANQHLPSFSIPKQIQFSCSVPFLSFALFFLATSYGDDVLYNHLCKLLEYSNIWYRFSSGIVLFTQSLPVQFHFISRLFFLLICFNFLCIWLSSLVVYTVFFPFHVIISIIIFAHSIWPDILPSYCHIHASRLLGKHQDSQSFSIWKPEKLIEKPLFNFFLCNFRWLLEFAQSRRANLIMQKPTFG